MPKKATTKRQKIIKPPSSLRLLGIDSEVVLHDGTFTEIPGVTGNFIGLWQAGPRILHVAMDHRPEHVADTFLHELLHAAIRDSGAFNEIGEDKEERVVEALSRTLIAYFFDNPEILEYFLRVQQDQARRRHTKRKR